jgi:GntR family transcriptional regulator
MDYDPMSPIWLKVVNRIKGAIVTGAIGPGEKMPGGRDLAVQYSINPNTAARVYQELEREGLCETRRGMGTYVTGNAEHIAQLRIRMAEEAADRYLRDLEILGLSHAEAIRLLNEKEES